MSGELIVKMVISAIALAKMVFPEPGSTILGIGILAGVWGLEWSPDGGSS